MPEKAVSRGSAAAAARASLPLRYLSESLAPNGPLLLLFRRLARRPPVLASPRLICSVPPKEGASCCRDPWKRLAGRGKGMGEVGKVSPACVLFVFTGGH